MNNIWLIEHTGSGQDNETYMLQEGKEVNGSSLRSCLNAPFRVDGETTVIIGGAYEALADLLLGIRFRQIQGRAGSDRYSITVAAYSDLEKDTKKSLYSPELLRYIVSRSQEEGIGIAFRDLDASFPEESFLHTLEMAYLAVGHSNNRREKGYRIMSYNIECPSFQDYLDKGDSSSMIIKNPLTHAMDFAHPLDAGVIKVLDNPIVNEAFKKVVNLATDAHYGLILSSGIRVDQDDSPLRNILRKCAETLGIKVPYTVISGSINGVNAMTVGSDKFCFIAMSSLLTRVLNEDQITFVLGHECGHIALGHVVYHTAANSLRTAAEMIPVLGPTIYQATSLPLKAWERRSEISADRAGLLCCGDMNIACRTLLQLEAGFVNADNFDIDKYIRDSNTLRNRTVLGHFAEMKQEHPVLAKRMEALNLFANSEKYYRLTGRTAPNGMRLLNDSELNRRTEEILKIL